MPQVVASLTIALLTTLELSFMIVIFFDTGHVFVLGKPFQPCLIVLFRTLDFLCSLHIGIIS
jgi:hypothetical protein